LRKSLIKCNFCGKRFRIISGTFVPTVCPSCKTSSSFSFLDIVPSVKEKDCRSCKEKEQPRLCIWCNTVHDPKTICFSEIWNNKSGSRGEVVIR